MLRFLAYLGSYLTYPLSFLVPRSAKKYAFGSPRGGFEGNPKYLFLRMSEQGHDAVWLSSNRETVEHVRNLGLKAETITSPKGAWRALRSGTWFVGAYTSDILWALSGGAKVVNLWHGVGLKRTEFNSTSGPMYDRYIRRTLKQSFYHPEAFRKPDLLITASDFQTPMFASAFRIPESRCLKCTYPRNWILTTGEDQRRKFIEFNCNDSDFELINRIRSTKGRIYIYMPTWRDSQRNIFTDGLNLASINSILAKNGDLLILKPHYNTTSDPAEGWSNIVSLSPDTDVYPFLPYTDCLITDYSSILYDYILMGQPSPEATPDESRKGAEAVPGARKGKSVILYLYDYDEYVKDREFYFPFDENVIGQRANTSQELEAILAQGPEPLDETKRQALADKFWGKENERHDISDYLHI